MPAGTYAGATALLSLRSVEGFRLITDGAQATKFLATASMEAVVDLNGVALSTFDGFTVESQGGTGGTITVQKAVKIHWDNSGGAANSARSTFANHFEHIHVAACRYVIGVQVGSEGALANNQVDSQTFGRINVGGGNASAASLDATLWQAGVRFGAAVFGNNLLHRANYIKSQFNTRGIHMAASQVSVGEAQLQANGTDIYFEGARGFFGIASGRSEQSARFISTSGASGVGAFVSVSDYVWHPQKLNADGFWIDFPLAGSLRLSNIDMVSATIDSGATPKIKATPTKKLVILIDGIGLSQTIDTAFSLSSPASAVIRGYRNLSANAVVDVDSYDCVVMGGDGIQTAALNAAPSGKLNAVGYRTIIERAGQMNALSAGARVLLVSGATPLVASGNSGMGVFYYDPAEHTVTGLSTKLRVRLATLTNDVAPAASFTATIRAYTLPVGAATVVGGTTGSGDTVTGSTVTVTTPAANTRSVQVTADFDPPVAGWYAIVITSDLAMAASSSIVLNAAIQVRHV